MSHFFMYKRFEIVYKGYINEGEYIMTYTFDIAYDCFLSGFLELLDEYELKLESYIAIGPGGGNPQITVSSTPSQIQKLKEFWNS